MVGNGVGQLGLLLFLPAPKVQEGGHGTHADTSKRDSNTQGDSSTEDKAVVGMVRRAGDWGRGNVGKRRYCANIRRHARSASGSLGRCGCCDNGCAGADGGRKTIVGIAVLGEDEELGTFNSAIARIGLEFEPARICRRKAQWKGSGSITGSGIVQCEFCGGREMSVSLSTTSSGAIAMPPSVSLILGCVVKGKGDLSRRLKREL